MCFLNVSVRLGWRSKDRQSKDRPVKGPTTSMPTSHKTDTVIVPTGQKTDTVSLPTGQKTDTVIVPTGQKTDTVRLPTWSLYRQFTRPTLTGPTSQAYLKTYLDILTY